MPRVELLWFDGCPSHESARALLADVIAETAPGTAVDDIEVPDPATAEELRFPGSPTIRVDGRDVDPTFHEPDDHTPRCRVYRVDGRLTGLPARAWIVAALRRSLAG